MAGVEDDLGAGEVEAGVVPPDLALQYSTVQYSTVQYSTVQYSTAQYLLAPQPVLVTALVMARPHSHRLVQVLNTQLIT